MGKSLRKEATEYVRKLRTAAMSVKLSLRTGRSIKPYSCLSLGTEKIIHDHVCAHRDRVNESHGYVGRGHVRDDHDSRDLREMLAKAKAVRLLALADLA